MAHMQADLFNQATKPPLLVAYGMGVDSTAVLVRLHQAGIRPDAILFADTGSEKQNTYAFQHYMDKWLKRVDFPPITTVRYQPKTCKNWPAYTTLGDNCLTNATLPSLAFGFKSCSMKWKVQPQNKWTDQFLPARLAWQRGQKVLKIIGYDASPKDRKRYAIAQGIEDPKYDYWYPLADWHMSRDDCKVAIADAGLPVPPKSACTFCPASKPEELHALSKRDLAEIVVMEARARPHLTKIEGLWGKGVKGMRGATPKPARMTTYIYQQGLLHWGEVESLKRDTPTDRIPFSVGIGSVPWHDLIEQFTPEDALIDQGDSFISLPVLAA